MTYLGVRSRMCIKELGWSGFSGTRGKTPGESGKAWRVWVMSEDLDGFWGYT
jgi:hypothetical protein